MSRWEREGAESTAGAPCNVCKHKVTRAGTGVAAVGRKERKICQRGTEKEGCRKSLQNKGEQDKRMRQKKRTKSACVTPKEKAPLAEIRYLRQCWSECMLLYFTFGIRFFIYIVHTITPLMKLFD